MAVLFSPTFFEACALPNMLRQDPIIRFSSCRRHRKSEMDALQIDAEANGFNVGIGRGVGNVSETT